MKPLKRCKLLLQLIINWWLITLNKGLIFMITICLDVISILMLLLINIFPNKVNQWFIFLISIIAAGSDYLDNIFNVEINSLLGRNSEIVDAFMNINNSHFGYHEDTDDTPMHECIECGFISNIIQDHNAKNEDVATCPRCNSINLHKIYVPKIIHPTNE